MPVFKVSECFQLVILVGLTLNIHVSSVKSHVHEPTIFQISINDLGNLSQYKDLAFVGKCCPVGQIMSRDESGKAKCGFPDDNNSTIVFSPFFCDYNKTGALVPGDKRESFVAVIGVPCRYGKYMLEPEIYNDDENYLLQNGSIFVPSPFPSMLSPGVDYCLEVVPEFGPENFLRTLVCAREGDQIVTEDIRPIFYACGLLISVPFLILTIIAYCITPKLMDVHGKAMCHYCGCLSIAFISLAFVQLISNNLSGDFCVSAAFVIQFSFLACFFWLNVMCIETYRMVRRYMTDGCSSSIQSDRLFFYYSLWAWTPPAILIVISIFLDVNPTVPKSYVKPNYAEKSCWFESDARAQPYFDIPMALLISANIVLFTMTAVTITRHQRALDLRRLRQDKESNRHERMTLIRLKRLFLVCLALFFLMGINWTMEVISRWVGGDLSTWTAFDLINALQGILVFIIFVLRKPIRHLVWYQVQKIRGIDADEPEIPSRDRSLLTVLNIDALPSRRMV